MCNGGENKLWKCKMHWELTEQVIEDTENLCKFYLNLIKPFLYTKYFLRSLQTCKFNS